jgi:hypothetical protein
MCSGMPDVYVVGSCIGRGARFVFGISISWASMEGGIRPESQINLVQVGLGIHMAACSLCEVEDRLYAPVTGTGRRALPRSSSALRHSNLHTSG